MKKPWAAEIDLSVELVAEVIANQFPQFANRSIVELGEGWDMVAYLVADEFVFRFPRRQVGADLVAIENKVLPQLISRVPLMIPSPEYIGQPTERYPWLFAGYQRIPGHTACSLRLNDHERTAMIPSLASFLSSLHSIPAERGSEFGAPNDHYGRLDLVKRVPLVHERLEGLVRDGQIQDAAPLHRLIDQTASASSPKLTALVHGDFYVRHLIVSDRRTLSGIIDWGDVHIGDPAIDLSIAFTFLPPDHRHDFRRLYGPIDEPTWQLARFRAISYGLILTDYGRAEKDNDLLREGEIILSSVLIDG